MDPLILSRWQFAITTIFHFFLVPLTLGLSILVAIFESMYVATGDETYKNMAKFWGKVFLINFAAGVVTGIVQEFHFGMNWSGYARFMGDIFGAPLAIEALLAFYMESTFIGLWVFGWDKLSKKIHLATIWLVAIASNLSALWILIANSFMQNPVGYAIQNGRAVMTDFWALLANPNLPYQFLHVFSDGITTAGFIVLGFSAWHMLRNNEHSLALFQRSFKWAAVYALVGIVAVIVVGDAHGKYLEKVQPMKISAAEAIWQDESPSADFVVVAGIDEKDQKNTFEITVPKALSFLLYSKFEGAVEGLKELQNEAVAKYGAGNYIPSVTITFWSFRIMVGVGFLMALLALLALLKPWIKFLNKNPLFMKLLLPAMALPYIASTCGWLLTEEARQPWIVYGLQKTQDAVSPNLTGGDVLFSLVVFIVLLGALIAVTGWLMYKAGTAEPKTEEAAE
ncbi:MAG TPA: cytochrome ubiquinol oxidase subunit I [Anaerolineales bacterium]|nr:cytochrome ubiquinol oxidase subunit I [Anaerolineales bacterium]